MKTITEKDKFREFEEPFKECFKELIECELDGLSHYRDSCSDNTIGHILWFVSNSGRYYCRRRWGDLEINAEELLDDASKFRFSLLREQWEEEVKDDLSFCINCGRASGFTTELICKLCWHDILGRMDDKIRKDVHAELSPCGYTEFLERYKALHLLEFGDDFRMG